jgi:predicted  nucleic acid-binding Zn-ribbon protein
VLLKNGLDKLYDLQKKDDIIKETRDKISEIPLEIKNYETERDQKTAIIDESRSKLDKNVRQRNDLEKKILALRDKIKKYRDQMSNATTNKEYQGFINEIKFQEDKIIEIEEKIIEKMLESDEILEEIGQAENEFKAIASTYDKKIEDLYKKLETQKSSLNSMIEDRNKLSLKAPDNLLIIYNNLFKKKNGKVLSEVHSDFCGVCNIKIRPQLLSELIISDTLFTCESCGRMLYKIYTSDTQSAEKPKKKPK